MLGPTHIHGEPYAGRLQNCAAFRHDSLEGRPRKMIGSWFDVFLVLILVGSIAAGLHLGFLRQALLLVVLYLATVLSAQYYGDLSALLMRMVPSASRDITDLLGFLLLLAASGVGVTSLVWTCYQDTRLPAALLVDNVGGALVGSVIGLFAIALTLLLTHFAVQAPWPDGSPIKLVLQVGLADSALQDIFSTPLPIVEGALRPLVPAGIPFMPST
jgi:uncharacterized membrane protein required for colicin V production